MTVQASRDSLTAGETTGTAGETTGSAALTREQMTDLVGGRAGAAMVFGEPVTADGLTIVPVARAGIGFGGADGGIIGGGTDIRPLGYIEIRGGVAHYRPIRDTWGRVGAPLTALVTGAAAAWAARSLLDLRRQRHRF